MCFYVNLFAELKDSLWWASFKKQDDDTFYDVSMWWIFGFFKVQGLSGNIFHSLLCSCLTDTNWCSSTRFLKGSDLLYIWIWFMNSHGGGSGPPWSVYKHLYMSDPSVQREGDSCCISSKDWKVCKVCLILTHLTVLVESETWSHPRLNFTFGIRTWDEYRWRTDIYMLSTRCLT